MRLFKMIPITAVGLLVLWLMWGNLAPSFLNNIAQIFYVNNKLEIAAVCFLQALNLAPQNREIRESTASAMIRTEKYLDAAEILKPVVATTATEKGINLYLIALLKSNQGPQAIGFYETLGSQNKVWRETTAMLTLEYLKKNGNDSTAISNQLYMTIFRLEEAQSETNELIRLIKQNKEGASAGSSAITQSIQWIAESSSLSEYVLNGEAYQDRRDEVSRFLASILNVPIYEVILEENIVTNSSFEDVLPLFNLPAGWSAAQMNSRDPWNLGLFVLGVDHDAGFQSENSLRIDGLVIESKTNLEQARAGFFYETLWLNPRSTYVISFVYRTSGYNPASLWVSQSPDVMFTNNINLPGTNGEWRYVVILTPNRLNEVAYIEPLWRSYSLGSLWIDHFAIHRLAGPEINLETTLLNLFPITDTSEQQISR